MLKTTNPISIVLNHERIQKFFSFFVRESLHPTEPLFLSFFSLDPNAFGTKENACRETTFDQIHFFCKEMDLCLNQIEFDSKSIDMILLYNQKLKKHSLSFRVKTLGDVEFGREYQEDFSPCGCKRNKRLDKPFYSIFQRCEIHDYHLEFTFNFS